MNNNNDQADIIIPYCMKTSSLKRLGSLVYCSGAVSYNKLHTGGNNPNITAAMRYSNYVKRSS